MLLYWRHYYYSHSGQSSFPVIHKVGNLVILVSLCSEGQINVSKKFVSSGIWTCYAKTLVFSFPCLVLIKGFFTLILFVHQRLLDLEEQRIQLKSIEHDYIKIFNVSILQEIRISTDG